MHTINGDGHRIEVIDVTHRTNGMREVTFMDRSNNKVWTEVVALSLVTGCPDRSLPAPLAPLHHRKPSIPVEFPVAERQTPSCPTTKIHVDTPGCGQVDQHFSRVHKLKNARSTREMDAVIQDVS